MEYQPIHHKLSEKRDIEYTLCLDIEMIKKLSIEIRCDGSCEDIHQEQLFIKIAVDFRRRKLHCFFFKQTEQIVAFN